MAATQLLVVLSALLLLQSAAAAPGPAWGAFWQNWSQYQCTAPGLFPDDSDPCSPVFRICVYMGPYRGLQPITKSCPAGSVFVVGAGCTVKEECVQKFFASFGSKPSAA